MGESLRKQVKAVCVCHRFTLSLPAPGSHPFPSYPQSPGNKHLKPLPLSDRSFEAASRTQVAALPNASWNLRWPAFLPKWHTCEQAVATLIHQVLAVLDLSPEVAQVLILHTVLLLEVFELQDQQEFLLINDNQPLLLILTCRGWRSENEVPTCGEGSKVVQKEGRVLAKHKTVGKRKG